MINTLTTLFEKYQIVYTEKMLEELNIFYQNVIEKNKVMNLTAITEKNDFAIKNILDCALAIKLYPQNCTLVDVGAGAGFPSMVIKILRKDIDVTMVDSLNKRVNFLNEQCQILGLKNICAVHSRAEDFAVNNRQTFDVAVARAVAKLNTLCELCLPLVKVGGMFVAYKSLKAEEEITQSKNAIFVLGGKLANTQNVFVKEINSIRTNVVILKERETPKKYPRSKNLPKTEPIE